MSRNGDKLQIEDLTAPDLVRARQIVDAIIASQSTRAHATLGMLALVQILEGHWAAAESLKSDLRSGLNSGLSGLYSGLRSGLNSGLYSGLVLSYCGVFWGWWLALYLIADAWGVPLDQRKLMLLRAFCILCPVVGQSEGGQPVVLPKPSRIRWSVTGTTADPFAFPIYELHGNGVPSVEYWGLFSLYHWHNVRIPERMGTVNCEHWHPRWLLDEPNAEVRRILLREIGYERAIATLGANVRDRWREYELIELTVPDMPVRYQLLKMTCPSTGETHVLRAPPDCDTAEQAITWCNHGHHPDTGGIGAVRKYIESGGYVARPRRNPIRLSVDHVPIWTDWNGG